MENQELRWLADSYMQTQKTRIAMQNRVRAVVQETDEGPPPVAIIEAADYMLLAAKRLQKMMMKDIKDHPAWPWLKNVKGISGTLGCKLLGLLDVHQAR